MVGENERDRCVFTPGVDKGLPPITVADDYLEKMNELGGADDKVNRRRKQANEEVVKVSDKDQVTPKKPRFIWTHDVHNCFLDAIKQIGFHRAVPTKILELMNVEDLTRENVASHLQKYRLQVKRRAKERAQARAASENVPKGVYPHMSGIPQRPCVLPNTIQGIYMDRACLDGSQLAPSFGNHNLNMIQAFPTVQEVHGTPFKDLFVESVNRMSSVRLVHGLYDSNGPQDINKMGFNYGPLPPNPLADSYSHNLMDRHDMTLVPQYDRRDESSLQDIISPFVPQCDRRSRVISRSFVSQYDQRDELFVADQGIASPSFVPQYDRHDELFVADQGIISPLLAQNMEGLGLGMPRPHTGVLGMKVDGLGLGAPCVPEVTGGLPCLPDATGGLAGMKVKEHVPHLPEATGGFVGGVSRLPEAIADLARTGIKAEGLGAGVTHLPEATGGPGLGVPQPPEASGGIAEMNYFQQGFSLDERLKLACDFRDFWMKLKGDVDGKSCDDLFLR